MSNYEKPVNFNTDKMRCSGTHFMTDELSSRVKGQLDGTMYKAPVIVMSPCAYCLLSSLDSPNHLPCYSLYHISQFLPPSVYVCAGVTCQNRYSLDM